MAVKIVIIDYGMGNLRSVEKAFRRLQEDAVISSDLKTIESADKLVLPGVGHFANGMQKLASMDLSGLILHLAGEKKVPILGICLGMQLLTRHSEEGDVEGLGLIDANTLRFNGLPPGLKIPHMGWNSLYPVKDPLHFSEIKPVDLVYFVHSYYVKCHLAEDRLFSTEYGIQFDSAFQRDNILGFQFHPEKSHGTGLQLLKLFSQL